VYYADHGGPGILGMPQGEKYLYGKDVVAALKAKHAANGYKKLVFYIEACESGSIFDGTLPADINVYATTAANPSESSWGCYCPGMQPSPPAGYNTCLGDLYSVAWMENTDASDRATETWQAQYESVKQRVSQNGTFRQGSHVMQYGDTSVIPKDDIDTGLGDASSNDLSAPYTGLTGAISNRDAELHWLLASGRHAQYQVAVAKRATLDQQVQRVVKELAGGQAEQIQTEVAVPVVEDWDCYKGAVDAFEATCGRLGNYGMKHGRSLANLCNAGFSPLDISAAGKQVC